MKGGDKDRNNNLKVKESMKSIIESLKAIKSEMANNPQVKVVSVSVGLIKMVFNDEQIGHQELKDLLKSNGIDGYFIDYDQRSGSVFVDINI